ncbi:hypothetical protein J5N97_003378 [Dioscorea zingiberensis]|uniref:Response regulatory domain-containing protein n=1 Tax=Dioscorea zingiberensis TaxID=325984 RepID=A0A9D5HR70_9LILI|nr:hypothetical protein J5N97_003378 [Dioscorea zingiberensis]
MVKIITGASRRRRRERNWDSKFPIGMRVMAVDDDLICLKLLEALLQQCGYEVTATQHPCLALNLLRQNSDAYDLVISDVQMPDMDGFKLLELIILEMDIPVVMLSVSSEVKTVTKGIQNGACDYIVKPVRLEELKIIWKHVVKRSMMDTKETVQHQLNPVAPSIRLEDGSSEAPINCSDRGKGKEIEPSIIESDEESSLQKKAKVLWSTDLHYLFLRAINTIGLDRASPKGILDLMDVPGLSRENVASHLQKYRKALKTHGSEFLLQCQGPLEPSEVEADLPRSMDLSFNQQVPDNGRSSEGFGLTGYPNYETAAPGSQSPWFSLPMSNQNILQGQYASTSPGNQGRIRQFSSPSHSPSLYHPASQPASSYQNHQPFAPMPNQTNGYLCNTSQNVLPSCIQPVTSFTPGLPNQAIDGQRRLGAFMEIDSSSGMQINEDTLNAQNFNEPAFNETSDSESVRHLSEPSATDSMFYFGEDDSADDLHALLQQI